MKRLFSLHALLFSFLVFTNSTNAQTNIKPGYVVSLQGDTVKGFIVAKNWEYNPSSIELRQKKDIAGTLYSFHDIREFRTEKEWYIRSVFEVETSPRLDNSITYDSLFNISVDTGFLQVLQQGEKSLYYFRKKNSEANLYIQENDKPVLLRYKRFIRSTSFNIVTGELNDYKQQLEKYLSPCSNVLTLIENAVYTETAVYKIFQTYNKNCSTQKPGFTRTADKLKVELGINAGAQLTKMSFSPSATGRQNFGQLVQYDHPASLNFTAGLWMNLVFQRGEGKTSLFNELSYGSFGSKWNTRVNGISSSVYGIYDCELVLGYIKLSNMLQYKIPWNAVDFYLKAGISTTVNFEQTNAQKKDEYFGNTVNTTYGKVLERTRKWDIGPAAGIGTAYKKLRLEIRYERNKGVSDYLATGSRAQRLILLAGFALK